MPIKLTWKSISGVLAILAGAISAAAGAGLPNSVNLVLISIGGVIVAAERVADALDYQTSTNAAVAVTTAPKVPSPVATPSTSSTSVQPSASGTVPSTATRNRA